MGRTVGVDVEQLREGATALKRARHGRRPSADESGFGSQVGCGAVGRFEEYWVAGQSAVDELAVALAETLDRAAASYERRDSDDAAGFRRDRGGSHAF